MCRHMVSAEKLLTRVIMRTATQKNSWGNKCRISSGLFNVLYFPFQEEIFNVQCTEDARDKPDTW